MCLSSISITVRLPMRAASCVRRCRISPARISSRKSRMFFFGTHLCAWVCRPHFPDPIRIGQTIQQVSQYLWFGMVKANFERTQTYAGTAGVWSFLKDVAPRAALPVLSTPGHTVTMAVYWRLARVVILGTYRVWIYRLSPYLQRKCMGRCGCGRLKATLSMRTNA